MREGCPVNFHAVEQDTDPLVVGVSLVRVSCAQEFSGAQRCARAGSSREKEARMTQVQQLSIGLQIF